MLSKILGILIIIGLATFSAFQIVGLIKDIKNKRKSKEVEEE